MKYELYSDNDAKILAQLEKEMGTVADKIAMATKLIGQLTNEGFNQLLKDRKSSSKLYNRMRQVALEIRTPLLITGTTAFAEKLVKCATIKDQERLIKDGVPFLEGKEALIIAFENVAGDRMLDQLFDEHGNLRNIKQQKAYLAIPKKKLNLVVRKGYKVNLDTSLVYPSSSMIKDGLTKEDLEGMIKDLG